MDMITNVRVYDLEESLIASGYPMRTNLAPREVEQKDIDRGVRLVEATKTGDMAHTQFLSGIRVAFDLTCTNKMWVEAERYRFLTFVSSQSTMHRITKFDLEGQYIKYVDPAIIKIMREKIRFYNEILERANNGEDIDSDMIKEMYLEILYSNPAGFQLTARMTTNYRCLRNIYKQRNNHRLPEWREFCKWIETLPYAQEFLIN